MPQPAIPYTEFGEVIRGIYKNPYLPESILPQSKITPNEHLELVKKWSEIVEKKNTLGVKKGLSLDEFTLLVNEFFGYQVINRSLIDRLIHTGNPHRESHAKTLRKDNLKTISYFTNKYSYDELKAIAFKVLGQNITENVTENVTETNNLTMEDKEETVKEALLNYLNKNGYKNLTNFGVNPSDILEILFEDKPKVEIKTILLLPDVLGIPKSDFLELLEKEIEF
ncbi:hypothetical protein NIES25_52440 [Nostoc linckia NIES-25]|nr:hypothetical protein NIES25_52440 [Nostoc linckia NIES-25]